MKEQGSTSSLRNGAIPSQPSGKGLEIDGRLSRMGAMYARMNGERSQYAGGGDLEDMRRRRSGDRRRKA